MGNNQKFVAPFFYAQVIEIMHITYNLQAISNVLVFTLNKNNWNSYFATFENILVQHNLQSLRHGRPAEGIKELTDSNGKRFVVEWGDDGCILLEFFSYSTQLVDLLVRDMLWASLLWAWKG